MTTSAVTSSSDPFQDLQTSTFATPRGFTYHYVHVPSPTASTKPTVLILHGFPSIPYDFHHQIRHLSSLGYGVLAPYLLGYAPTSTPGDPDAYRLKLISNDIVALLDHLSLTASIPAIGHDWGATLLSRLEYYHHSRISKIAYLTIGPSPFGAPFDLDKVNAMTKEFAGYEGYGYQNFFMDDLDRAARLLSAKHGRMEMLMFAEHSKNWWIDHFARTGGLEKWLVGNEQVKMLPSVTTELSERRKSTFIPGPATEDQDPNFGPGYAGSLMWYVGLNRNTNVQDEKNQRQDWEHYKTEKPVLLVLTAADPTAPPDVHLGMTKSQLSNPDRDLQVVTLDSGHFVMLERIGELNSVLEKFLDGI